VYDICMSVFYFMPLRADLVKSVHEKMADNYAVCPERMEVHNAIAYFGLLFGQRLTLFGSGEPDAQVSDIPPGEFGARLNVWAHPIE
jgi:hypothetical protein